MCCKRGDFLDCFPLDIPRALQPGSWRLVWGEERGRDCGGRHDKSQILGTTTRSGGGVRGIFGVLKTSLQPTPRMLKFHLKVSRHCWPPCPHSWHIYTQGGHGMPTMRMFENCLQCLCIFFCECPELSTDCQRDLEPQKLFGTLSLPPGSLP